MEKKTWLVILFFLIVLAVFFWPFFLKGWLPFPGDMVVGYYAPWNSYSYLGYAPGGVPHKAQAIDVARQLFPWKFFSIESLKQGQIPWWNPYTFAGNPHLANFQSSAFYPLNFIFFILPFYPAWSIFIFFQPLLACFFTYLFLREIKLNRWAAVLSGLAFAYSLYFTVWLEWGNIGHTLLWLPLMLFLIEKILKKIQWRWFLILIFSLVSSVLAGHVQMSLYVLGMAGAYLLFRLLTEKRSFKVNKRIVFVFLLAGLSALVICLPQILTTWRLFSQSGRWAYSVQKATELLLPPVHLVNLLAPDFFGNPASRNYWFPGTYIERVTYIGVLPLFFAFLAVLVKKKKKQVIFWLILAVLVLLLAINNPLGRLVYLIKVPLLATTVPTRALAIFSFCLAILAGFGFDFWLKTKEKRKVIIPSLALVSVYFFLWLFTFLGPKLFPASWWNGYLSITRRNLILPTGVALALGGLLLGQQLVSRFFKNLKLLFLLAILFLIIFDLFYYFQKITPFSPSEFVYPEAKVVSFLQKEAGINRFWGYGTGYIDSNFSIITKTYATDGYDPLFIKRYGELISASDDGLIDETIPRADVVLTKGFGPEALRNNPFRQRLLNLLGVKYVLQKNEGLAGEWQPDDQTFPEEIYQLVWQGAPWQVYENKEALPRAFLVGDYQVEKEKQKIVDLLLDPDFPLEKKIILEEALEMDLDSQASGEIKMIDYQPNRIEVECQSSGRQLLFLSDNFYDAWKVRVDGKESRLYRANYSFRAVLVPQGKHLVEFYYQPDFVLE